MGTKIFIKFPYIDELFRCVPAVKPSAVVEYSYSRYRFNNARFSLLEIVVRLRSPSS